jgi:transposase
MTRPSREPLRTLTTEERETLEKVVRSRSEAAEVVARAKSLLAVAAGADYAAGAKAAGRKSRDGVRKLVQRFNRDGVQALQTKAGAGCPATYTSKQRALILVEFRRPPDRELDGTGTWSLTT